MYTIILFIFKASYIKTYFIIFNSMKNDHSILNGDLSLQLRDLNETLASHMTRESGEKDYRE
jgi:hypothetical protein